MNTTAPAFGELPVTRHGRGRETEINATVDALRARPGEWAIVNTVSSGGARARTPWSKRGCEVTLRAIDGGFHVWARWPE